MYLGKTRKCYKRKNRESRAGSKTDQHKFGYVTAETHVDMSPFTVKFLRMHFEKKCKICLKITTQKRTKLEQKLTPYASEFLQMCFLEKTQTFKKNEKQNASHVSFKSYTI